MIGETTAFLAFQVSAFEAAHFLSGHTALTNCCLPDFMRVIRVDGNVSELLVRILSTVL